MLCTCCQPMVWAVAPSRRRPQRTEHAYQKIRPSTKRLELYWETHFLPVLVLTRWGAAPLKTSTGNFSWRAFLGKCEGSRLVGGTRLVVFSRFLAPHRPKRDPPLPAGTPYLFGKGNGARGPGSRGGPGSGFLELLAVWAWEYHEPGPPNEPGPLASPEFRPRKKYLTPPPAQFTADTLLAHSPPPPPPSPGRPPPPLGIFN